ncbi:MAG: hypothetical protein AABY22_33315 [Nanoarchaeota archaeon]
MNNKLFRDFVIIAGLFLIFFHLNMDPRFTPVFFMMIVLTAILIITDSKLTLLIERDKTKRLQSLALAVGGFFAIMAASYLIGGILKMTGLQSVENILTIFAEDQPLLKNSPWFFLLSTGILVSVVETITFAVLFEWLAIEKWKAKLDLTNLNFWLGAIFLSGIFMLLHLQARWIQSGFLFNLSFNSALLITLIFMLITYVIIAIEKQLLGAVLLHVLVNSVAIIKSIPSLFTGSTAYLIWGTIIALSFIVWISTKINLRRVTG